MFSTKLLSKLEKVILILRLYKNGFMKTLPVFSEFNMRDLLPLKVFCSSSSTNFLAINGLRSFIEFVP